MNTLDYSPGLYFSYVDDSGEYLFLARHRSIDRNTDMEATSKLLARGTWVAVLLEGIGDSMIERYKKLP